MHSVVDRNEFTVSQYASIAPAARLLVQLTDDAREGPAPDAQADDAGLAMTFFSQAEERIDTM